MTQHLGRLDKTWIYPIDQSTMENSQVVGDIQHKHTEAAILGITLQMLRIIADNRWVEIWTSIQCQAPMIAMFRVDRYST